MKALCKVESCESSDGTAAMWVPDAPFAPGETVTVRSDLAVRGASGGESKFTIERIPPTPKPPPSPPASKNLPSGDTQHFITRPDLEPPRLRVVTPPRGTAPGEVFLTPNGSDVQQGPLIVDNDGNVVWDHPLRIGHALDFAVQSYEGNPVLTWFQGTVSPLGFGSGSYVIVDQSYQQIALVAAGNGYFGDVHEFQLTPQNNALFTIYNPVVVDASSVGRSKHQTVLDAIVQEVDVPTGVVLFEWHSLGTIALTESYQPAPKDSTQPYDYVHPNSIGSDSDGNLLVSGRHTFATYKLDRATGALYWRLGGKKNNFVMGSRTSFAWQHDVRSLGGSLFSVFDNGASDAIKTHKSSRGIVLRVNEATRSATLEEQFALPKPILATSQGDFERLANGDYFTGWGSQPEYTEFNPAGHVVFDVKLPVVNANTKLNSYRTYRFEWHGVPRDPPVVVAGASGAGMAVSVSWNGATDVATWQVLGGTGPDALRVLGSQPRKGFETTIMTSSSTPYVAVQAMDASGRVLATSPVVSPS